MRILPAQNWENPSPAHPRTPPKPTQPLPKTRCPQPKGKKNPSEKKLHMGLLHISRPFIMQPHCSLPNATKKPSQSQSLFWEGILLPDSFIFRVQQHRVGLLSWGWMVLHTFHQHLRQRKHWKLCGTSSRGGASSVWGCLGSKICSWLACPFAGHRAAALAARWEARWERERRLRRCWQGKQLMRDVRRVVLHKG